MKLKKNHKWYYQVQGQLNVCQKDYCILAIWTNKGIKYEIIKRDYLFWTTIMLPKLNNFFFKCFLPELVDPRHTRNMPIRNPELKHKKKKKINV